LATVEFIYIDVPIPASDPFPNGQQARRPLALAEIKSPSTGKTLRCVVCLDTGADHCVFPAIFAPLLGIDLLSLKKHLTGGVGSTANPTYYTDLEITLGRGIQFKSFVGFTPAMDAQGIGLLGQFGFFNYYNVAFRHRESKFLIETT
jgi:hypothetical protein